MNINENYLKLNEIYMVQPDIREMFYGNNYQFTYAYSKWTADNYKLYYDIIEEVRVTSNEGVYMINDFYIGSSKNIKSRIIGHISECWYEYWNKQLDNKYDEFVYVKFNQFKANKIHNKLLNYGKLIITQLSENQEDEDYYINLYLNNGYNLTNIKHIKQTLDKSYINNK